MPKKLNFKLRILNLSTFTKNLNLEFGSWPGTFTFIDFMFTGFIFIWDELLGQNRAHSQPYLD